MNLTDALKSVAASIATSTLGRSVLRNYGSCAVRVEFPHSTLPPQLRGVFLVSMQHRILYELGETAPFQTRLLLHTRSGLKEIGGNPDWNNDPSTIYLRAAGRHACEISLMLAGLVNHVLSTTTFDGDGFVVTG